MKDSLLFKMFRQSATLVLIYGFACLTGCSTPNASPAAISGSQLARGLTLDTPVNTIAANPQGKAILEKDVPGLLESPHYLVIEDMGLSQLAPLSGGQLTKSELDHVQSDLAQLPQNAK